MTETLKPCPFCGSRAYIERGVVECTNPFCGASVTFSFPGKEREAWNNRQIEEDLDKKNGHLIETCHDLHDIVEDFRAECDQKDLEIKRLREALEIYKGALHEGLWKTGLQDSIWEVIEQAEEKAEQILKGGEE